MEMQPEATNSAIADAAVIADHAGQTVAPCSIPAMQNNFWLECPTLLQTESKSRLMYLWRCHKTWYLAAYKRNRLSS